MLICFLDSGRTPPASTRDGERNGANSRLLTGSPGIRFLGQAPSEAPDLDISSSSECDLESVPLPCIRAPFELLVTIIRPSDNVELGMEEPTRRSRNQCVNSRIVRHGVCLEPDVG